MRRGSVWLPCATDAKAPMPRSTMASRSRSSTSSASCSSALHLVAIHGVAGQLERLEAAAGLVALRLEAVERIELEERALDERGRHALTRRRRPGQRHGPELLRAPRRGGSSN